ncbi:PBSX family phage terminase large subunit [Oceaniglobus trochenteri]|uniref:PBSX family phage terminase large subunit n=1 Tax=Oceaniglobus trochenteri TaxID=2763260 RepID=UPI001D00063C|nr:PBSX family phage terminase large subunit [Oceaniglobus trochenteri]
MEIEIATPRWALPLQADKTPSGGIVRYKGVWGGRASGKSHEMAGMVVEAMVADPDCSVVCIREIQKSLALSAKKLIEAKIREFGVGHLFDVLKTEIRRIGGNGMCIFVGMQDHTADSVKSLEGFNIAWVEEAQSLSQRSLDLLIPTIRAEGSQIWASWNPRRRSDPIERLLRSAKGPRADAIVVRANYTDNPFLPGPMKRTAEDAKENDPEGYPHTWLGEYESVGSKVVIPAAWVKSAIGIAAKLDIEVTGRKYAALDVAGGEDGGDENALAIRKGISLLSVTPWNGLDTAITTQKATRLAAAQGVREAYYDSVGVGEGVTGEWASMGRRSEQPDGFKWHPWSGGASVLDPDGRIEPNNPQSPLNKDQYQNLKAQAWFSLRKRFENSHKAARGKPYDPEMMIDLPADLPNLAQIEEELTQPQHKTSGTGKTMVDKQPDGARSPNLADAINMAFFPCMAATLTYTGAI